MDLFHDTITALKNLNYAAYWHEFELSQLFQNQDILEGADIERKWDPLDKDNEIPIPGDLKDLVRLHYLVRTWKSRVILEFGVGKSTQVMLDALIKNKSLYSDYVNKHLRISNPFTIHSVDNQDFWLQKTKEQVKHSDMFFAHFSPCVMSEFNGRICTLYENLPNLRPDFIYLDAPSQFGVEGSVRGITTEHIDRMPMAADLLAIEYFLEPGTFIVVDGRTANARFLKNNFQRNWLYAHVEEFDQHFFYLEEEALGKWNLEALKFTRN